MSAIGQMLGKLAAGLGMLMIAAGALGFLVLFVTAGQAGSVLGEPLPSGIPVGGVYIGLAVAGAAIQALGSLMATAAEKGTGITVVAVVVTLVVLGTYVALHQALGGAPIMTLAPRWLAPGSGGCVPEISVEPIQAQPGQMLTVVGHCYPVTAAVDTYVDNHKLDSTATTDADGNLTVRFRLSVGSERAFPGMHSVQIRAVNTDVRASDTFRVVA